MIHSGSRNLGKKVADHYIKIANDINEENGFEVPPSHDLAYLPMGHRETERYFMEMNYCLDFALSNRRAMMNIIRDIIDEHTDWDGCFKEVYNIHHNYCVLEEHFGESMWVHRKGATSAKEDEIGIIPGSQGTKSYIVRGLGNPESFESCSHGSGRKMGRGQARRELNLEEEISKLNDQGIVHSIRTSQDLDEAAGAYKDVVQVMEQQKDLVEIVVELTPLAVIKG